MAPCVSDVYAVEYIKCYLGLYPLRVMVISQVSHMQLLWFKFVLVCEAVS